MKNAQEQLKSQLTQFVDAQINEQTMNQIQETIIETFRKFEGVQPQKVYSKNGWYTMSFKDKVLWWICTRLFPKISETINAQHYELLSYTDQPYCKIPLWAEKEPKSICVVDAHFVVPKPVENIKLCIK